MKNLNNIFTHEDTKKIYRREKVKYFKVFRAIMIFVALVYVIFIGVLVYFSNIWNTEQLEIKIIQAPEHHLAKINNQEAIVSTNQNGERSARVRYEFCEPLSWTDNCRWDRKIISVNW